MSFYETYKEFCKFEFDEYFKKITSADVLRALAKEKLDYMDFLVLLSPAAKEHLEDMAQKAHRITLQHFGRTVLLYTPVYLSNYCSNYCVYCSFSAKNKIQRRQLSFEQAEEEAKEVFKTGLRHVLLLTGESRAHAPVEYIAECVRIFKKYFSSVAVEIYPLDVDEYKTLIDAGVDSLTIYQEVYNEEIYDKLHISGPKKDYRYRMDAPERACKAKMFSVNIGALLGLWEWRSEAFFTGMHASYLQNKYLDTAISVSVPRVRPNLSGFKPLCNVTDSDLVQIILALRLFMPRVGITLSTRERASLRDNLIKLGVTRMSAGVSTEVGGRTLAEEKSAAQFEISDKRSVAEITQMLKASGYQPVFKDWC